MIASGSCIVVASSLPALAAHRKAQVKATSIGTCIPYPQRQFADTEERKTKTDMLVINHLLTFVAVLAASVVALPSLNSRAETQVGTISHATFNSALSCGPTMSSDDLDAGLFVGILNGGDYCNQYVRFVLDDGSFLYAKVVEGTDGNANDVIASKGVFDAFFKPLSVGVIRNVQWTLCSRSEVC